MAHVGGRDCSYQFADIGLWLARNKGMERKIETTKMGQKGTTIRIHSFIPSGPRARIEYGARTQFF